jgi:hypothetical protein
MKVLTALIVCLFFASALAQNQSFESQSFVIGEVSFFGYSGLPVDQIRSSLPIHEGGSLAIQDVERTKDEVARAVQRAIGQRVTEVVVVCCNDTGKIMVFVGLPGESSQKFKYNSAPKEPIKLPQTILDRYAQAMTLNREAVQKQPGEDRSKGYSLSTYAPLRETEMSIRELAIRNEVLIRRVLRLSAKPEDRRAAAYALGYAQHSQAQVLALVRASRDPDDEVRNNAVRALGVLATFSKALAAWIPAGQIVPMLNSGLWADRNKAALLMNILSGARDPRLLSALRARALPSLVEMARWKDRLHAWDARMIVGRIAGIEEKHLEKLATDNVEEIISAVNRSKH